MISRSEIKRVRYCNKELFNVAINDTLPINVDMEITYGKICFLDLDNTLLFSNEVPTDYPCHAMMMENGEEIYINFRPGALEFVKQLSELYDIIVWSAGSYSYVKPAVKLIEKLSGIKLSEILSREDTFPFYPAGLFFKNIHKVTICNTPLTEYADTIIVDDNKRGVISCLENMIFVEPWIPYHANDSVLEQIMAFIKKRDSVRNR